MTATDPGSAKPAHDEIQGHATATGEGLALLREILKFGDDWEHTHRIRERLFQPGGWDLVFAAASETRLLPALIDHVKQKQLLPPFPIPVAEGSMHPNDIMELQSGYHAQRRTELRDALLAAVGALNKSGITPTLLKGARYLWTGTNETRTMRDIDLLVPSNAAHESNAALLQIGYAATGEDAERTSRHHMPSLFHPDRPGWIELHRQAGNAYAESVFSTHSLFESENIFESKGIEAALPTMAAHIWHGVVHHYFGHSGFARGEIHLKPLYEFSTALMHIDRAIFAEIEGFAANSNVARACLELWVAAAQNGLGAEQPFLFQPSEKARQLAIKNLDRSQSQLPQDGKYPGYRELLKLAWSSEIRARSNCSGQFADGRLTDLRILAPKIKFVG